MLGRSESHTDPATTGAATAPRASQQVWLAPAPLVRRSPVVGMQLVGVGLLVTVLVTLLAVASTPSTFTPGAVAATPTAAISVAHTVILLVAIADLLALGLIISSLRPRRRGKGSDEEEHWVIEQPPVHWAWKLLAIVLPFLILAGLILTITVVHLPGAASHPQPVAPVIPGTPHPAPHSGPPGTSTSGSPDFTWVELMAAAVLAALPITIIIWSARARRSVSSDKATRAQTLAAVVNDSLEGVRNEGDPRRAVIVAYATMERMLAAHGFPRRAFEAPLEYLARVFQNTDAGALRTLTELFELAKFSHHDINLAMKEKAVSTLTTIRDGLRAVA